MHRNQQGKEVAQKIRAKCYLECSAETGEGIRDIFRYLTHEALSSEVKKNESESECLVI
jgi:Ras family protein A